MITTISQAGSENSFKLFFMFLQVLNDWKPPLKGSQEQSELRSSFNFDKDPGSARCIIDKFRVLFSIVRVAPPILVNCSEREITAVQSQIPSSSVFKLEKAQRSTFRFITSGVFSNSELTVPILLASALSTNAEVRQDSLEVFKRLDIDYEDQSLINYIRTVTSPAVYQVSPESSSRLFLLSLQILSKSSLSLNYEPFDSVFKICYFPYSIQKDSKLRVAALQFLKRASLKSTSSVLDQFAIKTLDKLKEYIKDGNLDGTTFEFLSEKSQIFEIMGIILSRFPNALKNTDYIEFLFDRFQQEVPEIKKSLQESLSLVLPVLGELSNDSLSALKGTLFNILSNSNSDQPSRYVAVRYAVRATAFDDSQGRILCLLGMNSENEPYIVEEAKRGLHPHWFKLTNQLYGQDELDIKFPDFAQFIDLLYNGIFDSENVAQIPPSVTNAAVVFAEQVLTMTAVQGHKTVLGINDQWDVQLDTALATDQQVRELVRSYISDLFSSDPISLKNFLSLLFNGFYKPSSEQKDLNDVILRVISQMPPAIINDLVDQINHLVDLLAGTNAETARVAANLIGIIGSCDKAALSDCHELLTRLVSLYSTKPIGKSAGFELLAAALILSRLALRGRYVEDQLVHVSDNLLSLIEAGISAKTASIVDCSIDSIGQLGLCGFPLSDTIVKSYSDKLPLLMEKGSERAVFAYGCLSLVDQTNTDTYISNILSHATSKRVDYMFSSGEALSIIAAGWEATVCDRYKDIHGVPLNYPVTRVSFIKTIIEAVLEKSKSTSQLMRKYSCLWLLSLTKYCGHLPECRQYLEHFHLVFMKFLSDKDDLVQESASRGLSMVFEMGDESLKQDLLHGLVKSFTSDTQFANSGTVSEDTQLFEPGVLDTGDGSISTYKDILNLASELGDSSLVYKFMSLARHNTLWATRKGAAFGLGNILAKANLDELLQSNKRLSKSLIPKLYRYGFDPNNSVQQSMRGIWDVLVKDRTKTLNDNFDDILDELLKTMSDREWRVRQASALALSDLLQSRPIDQYVDKLAVIWQMSFRIVDDIKDSVRVAGMQLTRGLVTSMIQQIDVKSGSSAKQAKRILQDLIPFLTGNNGIQSKSEEVQSFSLDALLKMCKTGGEPLKPYVPDLIEELLGLLSTLEPQAMNYLTLNASKYGLTSSDIDASRMASLRRSPMMEGIEQMIETLDDSLLEALIPKLSNVIKKSVGLPSKLGAGRVVTTLTIRNLYKMKPYADGLLTACQSQLLDRNSTVSQSYATAIGYLSRTASIAVVVKYVDYLKQLYFNSDDEKKRIIASYAVNSLSKHAADRFSSIAVSILPFVFVGKYDEDASVKAGFETCWDENTGGSGAISLYSKEITELASSQLANPRWNIRQTAATSVAKVANAASSATNIEVIPLVNTLLLALVGRSWDGKEKVLDALVTLVVNKKVLITPDLTKLQELNKVVLTEAKRRNRRYQTNALYCYGKYLSGFPQLSGYESFFELCQQWFSSVNEDDDEEEEKGIKKEESYVKVLRGIANSAALEDLDGQKIGNYVFKEIEVFLTAALIDETHGWRTKLIVMESFSNLVKKYKDSHSSQSVIDNLLNIWNRIFKTCAYDINHEKVRLECITCGGKLTEILDSQQKVDVISQVQQLSSTEKSSIVLTKLRQIFP